MNSQGAILISPLPILDALHFACIIWPHKN
jgi:hypothetical protein